jgi:SNF2 family DNA or RNA helicase
VNETNREYYKNAFGDKAKEGPTRGDDDFRFLVGSPRAGGVGLTLLGTVNVPCTNVFYYCQDFNYGARQQSEDRVHRIGLKHPVLYKDFTFSNSIEEYISQRLQKKGEISDMVKNVGAIKEVLLAGRRSA